MLLDLKCTTDPHGLHKQDLNNRQEKPKRMKPLKHISSIGIGLMLLVLSNISTAESFTWAADFEVGDQFPNATLLDHNNRQVSLEGFGGEKGYLIAFNRSVVW